MKKKLFLHIGFHKTGTSALQEYMNENRDYLHDNSILYPECYDKSYPGNVDLSWALSDHPPSWSSEKNDNEAVISFYKEQLENSDCNTIIISSEDFALLDGQPNSIKGIKHFLENFDVKIVAYIREPIGFIVSLYSHAIRSRNISTDLKTYIAEYYSFRAADYPLRLQPWIKYFGKENLILRKYEPNEFKNASLLDDFFDLIDGSLSFKTKISRSNIGIHPWFVESYLEVSNSALEESIKRKKLKDIAKLGESLPKEDAAKYLLDDIDLKIINNAYKVAMNRLKRDFDIVFKEKYD